MSEKGDQHKTYSEVAREFFTDPDEAWHVARGTGIACVAIFGALEAIAIASGNEHAISTYAAGEIAAVAVAAAGIRHFRDERPYTTLEHLAKNIGLPFTQQLEATAWAS